MKPAAAIATAAAAQVGTFLAIGEIINGTVCCFASERQE